MPAPINSPRIDPCQEVELLCLMTEESVTSKAVFFCHLQSSAQVNPTPSNIIQLPRKAKQKIAFQSLRSSAEAVLGGEKMNMEISKSREA